MTHSAEKTRKSTGLRRKGDMSKPLSRRALLGAGAGAAAILPAALVSATPSGSASDTELRFDGELAPGPDRPVVSTLTPFRDPLPSPPVVRPVRVGDVHHLSIPLVTARVRLHSQLPPTKVWSYGGIVPGPTIEVRRGQRLRVAWTNRLEGTVPVTAVEVPNVNMPWNKPGSGGARPRSDIASLPPWTAVHLHGAMTGANNDGWPENVIPPGDTQLSEYPNDQHAAMLLYHDHAMSVTRFNVFAGLVGSYVIRDDEEDRLRLPPEIPLLVTDRNLETDEQGLLTGNLLHKIAVVNDMGWMRAHTGPFTLVNGAIWPYRDVQAKWHRLRITNAANTRQYHFQLRDERGATVPMYQIGTDGGLLGEPVEVTGLVMGSAERADVLVDFSAYRGQRLELVNAEVNPDPGPWPHVMQFRVGRTKVHDTFRLPKRLSSFVPVTAVPGTNPVDRLVVLTPMGPTQSLLWEMARIPAPPGPLPVDGIIQLQEADGTISTYERRSVSFADPAQFTVTAGTWERWRFLHAAGSGWPHPMHMHVAGLQVLAREKLDLSGFKLVGAKGFGTSTPVRVTGSSPGEPGWKDTVRVQAAELVTVAAQFGKSCGKFVYHCHMLEHEDMGMMRHFRVMPHELHAVEMRDDMGMGGHHH